jgi:hypothetical protein
MFVSRIYELALLRPRSPAGKKAFLTTRGSTYMNVPIPFANNLN